MLRNILNLSWAYRLFGRLIGAAEGKRLFVRDYLRTQPGTRLLDIGCGPGNLLEALDGVEYVGFDMNPDYIRTARERYGKRGAFFERVIGRDDLSDLRAFDLAVALGVVHHLADEEAAALFEAARAALKPGGRFVTLDGCYRQGQSRIVRRLLALDRGRFVRTEEAYTNLAQRAFKHVKTVQRDDLLRIPYTLLIMECTNP